MPHQLTQLTEPAFTVSDLVASLNQTLEFAYPSVLVMGELTNFRISKNKWVYFDLKDELSSVKFFGTVYQLPGPLEDGMLLEVRATPHFHNVFGFSMNVQSMRPVGEGSLKRAAQLLQAKLTAEGLFDPSRKRVLPYPPRRIGLVTSAESAAFADFVKIINARWGGLDMQLADVQVQGEPAPQQIAKAIMFFNEQPDPVEVIVITRGGGSADDLAAFSTELVTRAVAISRIPTLVAVGHEIDLSLAELAADQRASTPSNAAELLVPDKAEWLALLNQRKAMLQSAAFNSIQSSLTQLSSVRIDLTRSIELVLSDRQLKLQQQSALLKVLSPRHALRRGYALVRDESGQLIKTAKSARTQSKLTINFADGKINAKVVT